MQTEISDSMLPDYGRRRKKLAAALRARNLDALLVSRAANRFYLSGFELHDTQPNETSGFLIITASGDDWLATDPRYKDAAARVWPEDRILIYRSAGSKSIADLLSRSGALIGFDPDGTGWQFVRSLERHLKKGTALLPAAGVVEKLRAIKEPCEIAALKKSFRLNHEMLNWLEHGLNEDRFAGIQEKQLAWEIEKFFRENGAQELAFATIAAIGENGALPHAEPGDLRLEKERPLLVDAGCRVDNYCSDQTRTFWYGERPSDAFLTALRLTRDAQEAALGMMRAGVACAAVYDAAFSVFKNAGVEKAFTHSLGHGVGLETHEGPSLSPKSKQRLEENMVVTVEPGLYYPDWGGIRWEYTVVVEKDGVTVL